ncbi:MAG TPA: heme A synthase [Thermomicrobiales bacterium]|nr:heme A synthase [Thermomicrobiales bacterium]
MRRAVKWLAGAATVGMFLVLVMGATVTNTGSAQGCGQDWPLCNGRFIPSFAVSFAVGTLIEWSHRAVTGVEGVLIVATAAGAWWYWRRRPEIKVLAPLMLAFLVLQAALGAWAVVYGQAVEVLALHFGVSLVAFASVLLTFLFVLQADGDLDALRDRALPAGLRRAAWALTAYIYVVVYLGAYVRHTDTMLACRDWPLCNGQVFPGFSGAVGIVFAHRLAAGLGVVALGWLALRAWRLRAARPDLWVAAAVAFALILLQALSGAIVVWTAVGLFSALLHSALVALLFGALTYLCLQSLPRPSAARAPAVPPYAAAPSRAG